MNDLYRGIVISNIHKAIKAAETADHYDHRGLEGRAREIFVSDLLQPYLYPTMGICSGIVIDSTNNQSKQTDVIIFDKQIVPPVMLTGGEGMIPYESVLATIEVKSKLTRPEVKKSVENALHLRTLKPNPSARPCDINGNILSDTYHLPLSSIFAYDTDLTEMGKTEIDRLTEVYQEIETDVSPIPIHSLCIVNRSSHVFGSELNEAVSSWKDTNATTEHEEVLNFILATINSCRSITLTRGKAYFGTYLV